MAIHLAFDEWSTARLRLRPFNIHDAPQLFELDANPLVMRFLGNTTFQEVSQSEAIIQNIRKQYQRNGLGRWAVFRKDDDCFLGWAGLKWVDPPEYGKTPYWDLGYRLLPEFWGQGIATEAASAWVDIARNNLPTTALWAGVHAQNTASQRVLQKLGFRVFDSQPYDGEPHFWLELDLTT
jgi:RimJ/RimL family protein N-acetyltransferase